MRHKREHLWMAAAGVATLMAAPMLKPARAAQMVRVDAAAAAKGSVVGRVIDAATRRPVSGRISAFADCRGSGCQMVPDSQLGAARYPTTQIADGVFAFDAYASQPAQLALGDQGYLLVRAEGYKTVAVAHKPRFTADASHPARRSSEAPTIALCKIGAKDQDSDGLCDDAERFYGADVLLDDTDNDGIKDDTEINGHMNVLTTGMFDLRAEGAIPSRKDVFVHLDYTAGRDLTDAALNQVIDAFSKSPHDEKQGILLHVLRGQQIADQGDIKTSPDHLQGIRDQFFPEPYSFPFHYCLSTDNVAGGGSGISPEIPGVNFAVTLKNIGVPKTTLIEAGTFMHELGHNLGLFHGGDQDQNLKPNYLSVMNYLYQWDGLQRGGSSGVIDFARFRVGEVSEANLNSAGGFPVVESGGLDDLIAMSNPTYCRRRARKGDCVTGRLSGQVPGAITFRSVPRCWSTRRCDLDGNGRTDDVFLAAQNDWEALIFNPYGPGPRRFVQENEPCPMPGNEADAPSDELDQPEPGDTEDQPPIDQLPPDDEGDPEPPTDEDPYPYPEL